MDKINEAVNGFGLSIDSGKVKEIEFELNTLNSGMAEWVSDDVINGELLSVIIDASVQSDIVISLADMEDVILFEDVGFFGVKYLPLSTEKVLKKNDILRFSSTNWFLNDKIKVNVKSSFNSRIKFKLRYK